MSGCASAWLAGIIGFGVAAAPHTADQEFLQAIDDDGIRYASPQIAIAVAHRVCAKLDDGASPAQLAESIATQTDLTGQQAGFFVGAAVATYCPWYTASP